MIPQSKHQFKYPKLLFLENLFSRRLTDNTKKPENVYNKTNRESARIFFSLSRFASRLIVSSLLENLAKKLNFVKHRVRKITSCLDICFVRVFFRSLITCPWVILPWEGNWSLKGNFHGNVLIKVLILLTWNG